MRIPSLVTLLTVFALGFIAALAGVGLGYTRIEAGITTLVTVISIALVVVIGFAIIVIALGGILMRKLVGTAETELAGVARPMAAGFEAWHQADRSSAIAHWEHAGRILLARFSWLFLQRGIVAVVLAIFGAYLGLLGSALLQRQNDILTSQNNLVAADHVRFRLERLDTAQEKLQAILRTLAPVKGIKGHGGARLDLTSHADPAKVTVDFVCPETAPCADGTVGAVITRVQTGPPPVIAVPHNVSDLQSLGLHRLIMVSNWMSGQLRQLQDMERNQRAVVSPQEYGFELRRAARLCAFPADEVDTVVSDLQLLRRLELASTFWGGRGPAPETATYQIFDLDNFVAFTGGLLAVHMRYGGRYEEPYAVSAVANQVAVLYGTLHATLSRYIGLCAAHQQILENNYITLTSGIARS